MFSFQDILNSSPQVKQYFSLYAKNSQQCMKLATQLMKQSIARRKLDSKTTQNNKFFKKDKHTIDEQRSPKQSRTNHYNVAYVKHNRFLSPSQKKQVTPKVTEIIPISPQKVFIYGKPKVKLDQFNGCEIHHNNSCQSQNYDQTQQNYSHIQQSYNKLQQNENINYGKQFITNENQRQQHNERSEMQRIERGLLQDQNYHNHNMKIPYQYEEYLSPKSKVNKKRNSNKTSKISQQQQNKTVGAIVSPKSSKQTNTSQRLTSPKSYIINPASQQNYSNVQSKIKQLINRDKRNREVEKQVERQKQQIQQLQQRQKALLLQQKEQQQEILRNQLLNNERERDEELWRIKNAYETAYNNEMAKLARNNFLQQAHVQSSFTSSSQDSIVNLHGHQLEQSRVECYECQIQRLRKRKQKAKQAIKEIEKQEAKRNQLLLEIAQSNTQQFYPQMSINKYQNPDQSYGNSLSIY